eukprot:77625-Pyramimonas_sp.AAC.1
MECGSLSKCGARLSAAHIRFENVQELHGWRAGRFQHVVLALAPRTFVLKNCNGFTHGGRVVFTMSLSP